MERMRMRPQGRVATVAWFFCLASAALAEPTAGGRRDEPA
jgi:hypothetical protein